MVITMKSANNLFTADEVKAIEATIAEAEQKTSGEVVPVVATASGRYDRAEDLFGFLLALLVLVGAWCWLQGPAETTEAWSGNPTLILSLPIVVAILVVTFIIGTTLATHLPALRLPLITRAQMQEEVESSARETFQKLKIRNTEDATGILIYVSLYEHMVHVEGDDAISAKLSQDDWQHVCDAIIDGFKSGNPAEGMQNGLRLCGDLLAQHFPTAPDDSNEIIDTLHLID